MDEAKKENEVAEAEKTEGHETPTTEEKIEASKVEDSKATQAAEIEPKQDKIGELCYLTEVRTDLPDMRPGDVVRVFYRVIEGGKERTQVFAHVAV